MELIAWMLVGFFSAWSMARLFRQHRAWRAEKRRTPEPESPLPYMDGIEYHAWTHGPTP